MLIVCNLTWDGKSSDTVTLTGAVTFDTQDAQDGVNVASVISTIAARAASVHPTVTASDASTMLISAVI